MRQFYDMLLLVIFIVLICVFMVCCQNRSRQVNERNAKLFEMRATTPGESELEYEDIESDEMNNDNNDAIADNLVQKGIKSKSKKKKRRQEQKEQSDIEIQVCGDDDDDASDSSDDEMSMARMREEYYKSQTLAKKFSDLVEDISDMFNGGKAAMQRKFKKKKPMIVRPMMMSIDDDQNEKKGKGKERKVENNADHSVDSESDEKVKEKDDNSLKRTKGRKQCGSQCGF